MLWAYSQRVRRAKTKFVLVTVAMFANHNATCNVGIPQIADMTGMDTPEVETRLKELGDLGLIGYSGWFDESAAFMWRGVYHLHIRDNPIKAHG